MNTDFINLTTENLASEHLCCIIRSKKHHPGVEAKRQWLAERLEGRTCLQKVECERLRFSLNMLLLKWLGYLSLATTIIMCIACGLRVVRKEVGMDAR